MPPIIAVLCVLGAGPAVSDERLLLGFEEHEVKAFDKVLTEASYPKQGHVGKATVDGSEAVTLSLLGGYQGVWHLFRGESSQGEYAMGLGQPRWLDRYPWAGITPRGPVPEAARQAYWFFHDNYAPPGGMILHTCGVFRGLFPMDWSAYDRLRLDVLAKDVPQTVRVMLEDEEVAPPVTRDFRVDTGAWRTLEFDLRQAEKERRLDLKRMATITIGVAEYHGKTGNRRFTCLMDNVRLSPAQAPVTLPLVHDDTPWTLPDYFRTNTTPAPEKMPNLKPDRTPLTLGAPIVIPAEKGATMHLVGWPAAFDNQRLLIGYSAGRNVQVLQSLDGGKTWTGLDGDAKPTIVPSTGYLDHQNGRGDVVGRRGDAILLVDNCNGGGLASLRLFAQKLTFTGASGWRLTDALVDCDPRHCASRHSIVRAPDGRLWAAYGLASRLGTICMNVRYSDDDGVTWKPSREYTSGLIPWSLFQPNPQQPMTGSFSYTFEEPCLVPFGTSVACLVQTMKREGGGYGPLVWSRLENGQWTAPEPLPEPTWTSYYGSTMPTVKAVSIDAREIFVVDAYFDGVLHYKDGQWTREATDVPANAWLCVAGERTVVAVGAVGDYRKGPITIRAWQRKADGAWAAPVDVAREEKGLAAEYTANFRPPGFVVPAVSPPNFVPVLWQTPDRGLLLQRIPVVP